MNSHTRKSITTDKKLFLLEQLTEKTQLNSFVCSITEYNDYLLKEAVRSQKDQMALTWLFRERSTGNIAAYMSLIADAIKLSTLLQQVCGRCQSGKKQPLRAVFRH
jgi:hypothetical protein